METYQSRLSLFAVALIAMIGVVVYRADLILVALAQLNHVAQIANF